jgi:hypothetical protein
VGAPRGVPHHIQPLASRNAKLAAAKAAYPSTQFGTDEWHQALRADDRLFTNILNDVARFTRLQLERGRLHLDEHGREITPPKETDERDARPGDGPDDHRADPAR